MENSPELEVSSDFIFQHDQKVKAKIHVTAREAGRVNLGYFVPSYLRDSLESKPEIIKKKLGANESFEFEIELAFKPDVPAQAYYFTVFAVQNMSISTCRQHFGLEKK